MSLKYNSQTPEIHMCIQQHVAAIFLLLSLFLPVLPAHATCTCSGNNQPNLDDLIDRTHYQVVELRAPKDGGDRTIGTATAIDSRGYFVTAMHVVQYADPENLRLVLGPSRDPKRYIKFESLGTGSHTDIDFVILKALKGQRLDYGAVPLLLGRDHPWRGRAAGFVVDGHHFEVSIDIEATRKYDNIPDDVTVFHTNKIVHEGQSGSLVISECGMGFASLHKKFDHETDENLRQKGFVAALESARMTEGNFLVRPKILRLLRDQIPPSDILVKLEHDLTDDHLGDAELEWLYQSDRNFGALDLLHIFSWIRKGWISSELGERHLRVLNKLYRYSEQKCLSKELILALQTIRQAEYSGPGQTDARLLLTVTDFGSDQISVSEQQPTRIPVSITDLPRTTFGTLKFQESIENSQFLLARYRDKNSAYSEAPAYVRNLLLQSVVSELRHSLPPVTAIELIEVPIGQRRRLAYAYSDLALAEDLLAQDFGVKISSETLSAVQLAEKFGGTPTSSSLAATLSRRAGYLPGQLNFSYITAKRLDPTNVPSAAEIVNGISDNKPDLVAWRNALVSAQKSNGYVSLFFRNSINDAVLAANSLLQKNEQPPVKVENGYPIWGDKLVSTPDALEIDPYSHRIAAQLDAIARDDIF
ncbi:serine protease [Hwanghaeella grinnelliae]|uniref:Serine protease n=1 Tax=Hwanghaeella grinnelliae TaxID=2500179 RepID=A0A3S2W735_9PROT|nr:serine protease [Hwanghaeella grinnelliae]RVU38883.1 serine protease [Hwanghaeella grinnelliae]